MANESVELPVMPELTKSCEVKIRRYSADKSSSGNSAEKIVPHYLRASTGSCHDFCKFGRNHAFELKDRRSIPNRATRKQLHQSSEESIGAITVSVPRSRPSDDSKPKEKMSVESVGSRMRISDASDIDTHEMPTKSVDRQKCIGNEVKVNREKTSLVNVKPSLLLKSHTSSSTKQEISSASSSSSSSAMQSPLKSTSRKAETQSKSTPKKVKTPSKLTPEKVITSSKSTPDKVKTVSKSTPDKVKTVSKSIPEEEVNPSKLALQVKTSSKSTPKVENVSKPTLKKVENPSKSISKVKTSSTITSKMVGTSSKLSPLNGKEMKLSTSLNANRVTRKKTSSINSSEGEIKLEKAVASSKPVSRKLMSPIKPLSSPRISLRRVASINSRKHKGPKIVSHLRNQQTATKVEPEELDNIDEVEEKTLYVIKMESENKNLQSDHIASYDDELYLPQLSSPKSSSSSPQEDQEESEYTTSEFEQDSFSGNHEIECMENEATLGVEHKGKSKKNGTICHEDKMTKLKFRRGKVVDNQIEKSGPKRLKFRRAKTLVEKANDKDDAERKSYKRKDEIESNSATSIAQEKVVLRHQDMLQDKKDGQGLLNNVIEETASKLVETRKSKVKALVGAFETVISLQEKKPSSANIVS